MASDTVTTLTFTGVLEWTVDAACGGETDLFFAPAGERPRGPRRARGPGPLDLP